MARRTVTALLWLLAVWTIGGALSIYAAVPSLIGPVVGLAVAALVWWDPSGRLWKAIPNAAVRRRLASLERVSDLAPGVEIRRGTESAQG